MILTTAKTESLVDEIGRARLRKSTTGHEKSGGNIGGPPPKAKYYSVTDREQYREGKVKRTPGGE